MKVNYHIRIYSPFKSIKIQIPHLHKKLHKTWHLHGKMDNNIKDNLDEIQMAKNMCKYIANKYLHLLIIEKKNKIIRDWLLSCSSAKRE